MWPFKREPEPVVEPAAPQYAIYITTIDGSTHRSDLSSSLSDLEARLPELALNNVKWVCLEGEYIQRDKIVSVEVKKWQRAYFPNMW